MFLQSVATMVRPDPTLVAPIRDPNDIIVLQTAIIGGAEAICTTDDDFFHTPALAFLKSVSILVFTDMELMGRLRS
jgi:predicted nucleic acid-binding protein